MIATDPTPRDEKGDVRCEMCLLLRHPEGGQDLQVYKFSMNNEFYRILTLRS